MFGLGSFQALETFVLGFTTREFGLASFQALESLSLVTTPPESSGSPCRPPRSRYRFLIHSKKPKQKKPKQQKGKQKNSHPPYRYRHFYLQKKAKQNQEKLKQQKAKQKKSKQEEEDLEMPKRKRIPRQNGECFMLGCTNIAPASFRSKWCKQHEKPYRALYRSAKNQDMLDSFHWTMQCPKSAAETINAYEFGLWQ